MSNALLTITVTKLQGDISWYIFVVPFFRDFSMRCRAVAVFCVLLVFCSLSQGADVVFEGIDGEGGKCSGTLLQLTSAEAVFDVQGNPRRFPLTELHTLRSTRRHSVAVQTSPSNGKSALPIFPQRADILELNDGSLLITEDLTIGENQAIFRLTLLPDKFALPLNAVSAIRFAVRNENEAVRSSADWDRLSRRSDGDQLVIGHSETFDVYTGILQNISAETIFFGIDGERLPVPRHKVFGLVLHQTDSQSETVTLATLTLWSGTKILLSNFRMQDGKLTVTAASGLNMLFPLETIEEIEFKKQRSTYLTDLNWERSEFSLPFETELSPQQFPLIQTFYEAKSKRSFGGSVLDGTFYERCFTLTGRARFEFRLPKPYAAFKAVVGIEDQYRPYTAGVLKILADSQLLGTWELHGNGTAERVRLNLPKPCRILTFVTETIPNSNRPPILTIGEAVLLE